MANRLKYLKQVGENSQLSEPVYISPKAIVFEEIKNEEGGSQLVTLEDELGKTAPAFHADSDPKKYGQGNGSLFGHVKLSDEPSSSRADLGVAATPYAVNLKADEKHDSETDKYGAASLTRYGHVKLSNRYNQASGSDSLAATEQAVCALYNAVFPRTWNMEYDAETRTLTIIP